ncbi:hypothetical protein EDB92DRAFT_2117957 [Lactarius akahatsu]|uniref:Uncharacterized protein n=1 Tax=Lactarius akahatsu TaxID=416441 RepID=A0AAD4Q3T2_9AGAM|nr:hypothetical protein EDB92DRAFT_2117957 [Lactarius akahatsu]
MHVSSPAPFLPWTIAPVLTCLVTRNPSLHLPDLPSRLVPRLPAFPSRTVLSLDTNFGLDRNPRPSLILHVSPIPQYSLPPRADVSSVVPTSCLPPLPDLASQHLLVVMEDNTSKRGVKILPVSVSTPSTTCYPPTFPSHTLEQPRDPNEVTPTTRHYNASMLIYAVPPVMKSSGVNKITKHLSTLTGTQTNRTTWSMTLQYPLDNLDAHPHIVCCHPHTFERPQDPDDGHTTTRQDKTAERSRAICDDARKDDTSTKRIEEWGARIVPGLRWTHPDPHHTTILPRPTTSPAYTTPEDQDCHANPKQCNIDNKTRPRRYVKTQRLRFNSTSKLDTLESHPNEQYYHMHVPDSDTDPFVFAPDPQNYKHKYDYEDAHCEDKKGNLFEDE